MTKADSFQMYKANKISYITLILAFTFFCFLPQNLGGQSLKQYERAGDKAMLASDYNAALHYFKTVLDQDKNNRFVQLKYAECALEMNAFATSEQMLKRISKDKTAVAQWHNRYYLALGRALLGQGKYTPALTAFEQIRQPDTNLNTDALKLYAESCRWAISRAQEEQLFEVKHGGKTLNSPYSDFAPTLLNDTLYYSSYRFKRAKNAGKPPKKWTKVLYSIKGNRPKEATNLFREQDTVHIAHTAFSPNGNYQIYTQCRDTLSSIRCDLYLTMRGERGQWLPAIKLPDGINQQGYTTTQPHIAQLPDGLTLFFVSDRPGGIGNLDIYRVALDSQWFNTPRKSSDFKPTFLPAFGKCAPLTSLNTVGNDVSPYVSTTTSEIWWSSDGRPGYGGYDVFRASVTNLDQPDIKNAGTQVNTSYHDLYFMIDTSGKSGWLASNRPGSVYLNAANKACCFDLYKWQTKSGKPIQTDKPLPPSITQLTPPAEASTPPTSDVPTVPKPAPLTPKEHIKSFVGLPLYFDNDEPDKRTRRNTTNKDYETTVLAYLSREEEYRERWSAGEKREEQKPVLEQEIISFFEDEIRRGYDRLFELTELIHNRLQAGEQVEIVVKGYTSPRAQSDYNLQLGYRRISSIRNHFERWNEGALKPYILKNQFVIRQTSFGETTASVKASDRLEDERNSIYNPVAARERRVEIVEIKTQ